MAYRDSQRYEDSVAAFLREASTDPTLVLPVPQAKATADDGKALQDTTAASSEASTSKVPYSLVYHKTLAGYVERLSAPNTPSEGASLASYCQHIRRWDIPRSTYPEGLSGYKSWRFKLNKYHTEKAFQILQSNQYDPDTDSAIYKTIENLLQKKTLRGGNDKSDDEEMQLFEDAICLTFLELEFAEFLTKHDETKMISIVQKTWNKMGHRGRSYAREQLASRLPLNAQALIGKALSN